jgi:membrane protein DedA with SNARE-associated domain
VISLQSRRLRRGAWVLFALALLPTLWFGLRTTRSFLLLRSAYEAGAPKTSSIRGWMTLGYVAATYHTPQAALLERLGLPPSTATDTTVMTLADQAGLSPPRYVERVQRAVADVAPRNGTPATANDSGWLAATSDKILSALLVYGYPVLAGTLLLGAIGLPLPDGIATAVAGSLAAQGRMDWLLAAAIIVIASVLGDLVGYGLGRLLGGELLKRRGGWFGYTPARRGQVQRLFNRWGLLTVFITRTFVSYLSSVASVLAGVAHYRASTFLVVAVAGRLVWAAAYLGLGYAVGSDLEAAASFLTNLSLLLLSLTILAGSGLVGAGRVPALSQPV